MIAESMIALAKTTLLPTPTNTGSPANPTSVAPIPTVLPDRPEYQLATQTGTRTLWVVFIVMVISSAIFAGLSWTVPLQKRLFHVITTLITIFAALSYFAMATGAGSSLHHTVIHESHDTVPDTKHEIYRQVFFARYVDWTITTPLLLLDLAILAGLSGVHIVIVLIADVIMILTGLFAAYGHEHTAQKWGWYTIGCIAYLTIVWHLVYHGRNTATRRSSGVGKFYTAIAGFTIVLWTLYPIVWGIADGSRKLSVNREIIAYAVLDILAKPVFGTWLLITHSRVPETQVDVGGWWITGFSNEGALRLDDDEGA